MLNSIEVLWFTHVNGRVQFRALFRQFTNIFCYAQKRCARGDTAPLSNFVCMISSEILMIETWDKFFLVTQDNVYGVN